ncbi:DNA ligase [Variovorax sp. PBL-E5]|uniref:DNA ligase n=1 Tax=Variovorax sp. PBL-E5 TaxID=434014 RepID=UPI001318C97C|nr:DNA ligase [Variovorax sp. PBL-E5]VTU28539.1 DNA ligase [Variovorax sp. PBL-E5]
MSSSIRSPGASRPVSRRALLFTAIGAACTLSALPEAQARNAATAPALMRPEVYRPGLALNDQWVSEKYDGVRGYWDGKQLWTRGGERVTSPAWFTAALPAMPMDGELWAGRGRFSHAVSAVRSETPVDAAWREMHFMVFDLPTEPGDFTTRLAVLRKVLPITAAPWLVLVPQQRATTPEALQALLDKTVRMGGEGLVLHRGASPYRGERTADLLKFKPYDDAEARVVAHVAGRGKYAGRLGALLVEMPDGKRFKIGSGFSDAERDDPPAIGSWVTYRYNGTNPGGVPRFARFMRVRDDVES